MSVTPIRQPIEKEGLVGTLFYSSTPGPHPTVIVLGGSGGGLKDGAATLSSEGFTVLALAYFSIDLLSPKLVEIQLEYFSEATTWLKDQPAVDPQRIALMGNSKGGELAIRAVVGYLPSGVVWQGQSFNLQLIRHPGSSWSLEGDSVPFVRYATPRFSEMVGIIGLFAGSPIAFRSFTSVPSTRTQSPPEALRWRRSKALCC
jgi:hypothetical protein